MRLLLYLGLLLLSVSVDHVYCPPGVIVGNRTYCFGNSKIPMDLVCDNLFSIGNESFARVHRPHIEDVHWPFGFHGDEGVMQVLQFVAFTHLSVCDVGDDKVMERIIHYIPRNCTEPVSGPESAASAQGALLSVLLLTVALLYLMIH